MATYMQLRSRKHYYPIEHVPRKRPKVSSPEELAFAQRASLRNLASNFFRLPRELRDIVYEYVWGDERAWIFRSQRFCIAASNRQNLVPPGYGLPSWVLASEVILAEAIATLHRTHTFEPFSEKGIYEGPKPFRSMAYKNALVMNKSISKVRLSDNYIFITEQSGDPWLFWNPRGENKGFVGLLGRLDVRDINLVFEADAISVRGDYDWSAIPGIGRPLDVLGGRCRSMTMELGISMMSNRRKSPTVESIDNTIAAAEACVRGVVCSKDGGQQFETTRGKACIRKEDLVSVHLARMK